MLMINKEQIDNEKQFPIYIIEDILEQYIISQIKSLIKIEECDFLVYIDGYETMTQNPDSDINISIKLSEIDNRLEDKTICFRFEERELDGEYEDIEQSLEVYLSYFNTEFNKILDYISEQIDVLDINTDQDLEIPNDTV